MPEILKVLSETENITAAELPYFYKYINGTRELTGILIAEQVFCKFSFISIFKSRVNPLVTFHQKMVYLCTGVLCHYQELSELQGLEKHFFPPCSV